MSHSSTQPAFRDLLGPWIPVSASSLTGSELDETQAVMAPQPAHTRTEHTFLATSVEAFHVHLQSLPGCPV